MIDIGISSEPTRVNPFVMFIDNNGQTKLLKNRWGNMGIVINKKDE